MWKTYWNEYVFFLPKGQGVLSEGLRSFSMQDLSSYNSDADESSSGTSQPATGAAAAAAQQHRSRTMMRSKSESYNKGTKTFDQIFKPLQTLENRVCWWLTLWSFIQRWLPVLGSCLPMLPMFSCDVNINKSPQFVLVEHKDSQSGLRASRGGFSCN